MVKFKALILAGKTPEINGKDKILIDLFGKPVIKYVVEALEKSAHIGEIAIIGPKEGLEKIIKNHRILPDQGNFYKNCIYGYNSLTTSGHILFSYSDIPLVTPQAIDFFLKECTTLDEVDLFIAVCETKYHLDFSKKIIPMKIPMKTIEGKFRTANLALANASKVPNKEILEKAYDLRRLYRIEYLANLIAKEKSAKAISSFIRSSYPLIRLIGLVNFARGFYKYFISHNFSLEDGKKIIEKRFGTRVRIIQTPFAESVHDIDTIGDLEFVKTYLKQKRLIT